MIEPLSAFADVVIIVLAAIVGGIGYHLFLTGGLANIELHASLGLVTGLIYVISGHNVQLYRIQNLFREGRDYQRVLTNWAFAVLVLTVILFALKIGGSVSRGSIICFIAIGGICLASWRKIVKGRLRMALETGQIRGRRAILLGDVKELAPFPKRDLLARFGVEEIERIALSHYSEGHAVSTLAAIDTAMQCARDSSAEEVILALPWADVAQREFVLSQLRLTPLPVRLLPDRAVSAVLAHQMIGPVHSLLVEIQRAPLSATERLMKRALDIVIAGGILLVLTPLMALTTIAVKLKSPGPIIFRQRRKGFNGKVFVIYKFRTMTVLEDGPSVVQATKGDPRVTRLGRVLRQTSIDELPQLLNVLRGDMSLVGPRPHAVAHDDEYVQLIANYAFRHHVKPGITGWAQVHGCRGETPRIEHMGKRIEFDLWYVNNWSVALDLQVMMQTCLELFRTRNAY